MTEAEVAAMVALRRQGVGWREIAGRFACGRDDAECVVLAVDPTLADAEQKAAGALAGRVVQFRGQGLSYREIAERVGVSHTQVSTILRGSANELRGGRALADIRNREIALRAVKLRETMTYQQIADELGVSEKHVRKLVRRTAPEAVGGRRAPKRPYGLRLDERNDEIVAMKLSGAGHAEITARFGVCSATVTRVLKEKEPMLLRNRDAAVRRARIRRRVAEGASLEEVAEEFGTGVEKVYLIATGGAEDA